MTRCSLLFCALLLPFAAQAQEAQCRHSEPRQLELDMDGVRTVMFEIGNNKLRLDAASGAAGAIGGRACASNDDWLEDLKIEQRRDGDSLHVRLHRDRQVRGIFLGRNYAYLDLSGSVPDDVLVQLKVGSGDAWLTGASAMSADVGSGDVEARRIVGLAAAKVGSGDIGLDDVGSLNVLAIGSGDVEAGNVRGDVEVGSIGSGDFDLHRADGDVRIGSIGSGDAELRAIGGSVRINSIGSGDIRARGVGGDLTVSSKGSGSVRYEDVAGQVDVPRKN